MRFQINYRLFGGVQPSKKLWFSQSIICLVIFIRIFAPAFFCCSAKLHNCHVWPEHFERIYLFGYRRASAAPRPFATRSAASPIGRWSRKYLIFLLILAFLIYFFRFVDRSFWLWPLIDLHSIDQQQNTQNWIVYVYDGHRMADRVSFAQRYRRVKHSSWSHLKTDLSTYLARWRWRKRIWRSEMETHNEWRTHIDRNWSRNRLCRSSSSSSSS